MQPGRANRFKSAPDYRLAGFPLMSLTRIRATEIRQSPFGQWYASVVLIVQLVSIMSSASKKSERLKVVKP